MNSNTGVSLIEGSFERFIRLLLVDGAKSACRGNPNAVKGIVVDDIGRNLKPARLLGMITIKVEEPATALSELGTLLSIELV